jgi:plastocyanin
MAFAGLNNRWRSAALVAVAAAGVLLVACGDEAEEEAAAPAEPQVHTVNLVDYAFEGLPESFRVGDSVTVTNSSATELHELVAVLLPADETRSVEELLALPMEELGALFHGPPAMVLLVAPNSDEVIPAVGDGTFTQAGRYALICAIPAGADPDEFLAAAAAGGDGPPEVAGGPPHFVFGMWAEVEVTE